jgi:pilus assembly protein Flp/PilA
VGAELGNELGTRTGDHMRPRWLLLRLVVEQGSSGQGLTEYALLLALIAVVAIAALLFLGTSISSVLDTIGHTSPFS